MTQGLLSGLCASAPVSQIYWPAGASTYEYPRDSICTVSVPVTCHPSPAHRQRLTSKSWLISSRAAACPTHSETGMSPRSPGWLLTSALISMSTWKPFCPLLLSSPQYPLWAELSSPFCLFPPLSTLCPGAQMLLIAVPQSPTRCSGIVGCTYDSVLIFFKTFSFH